MWIALHWQKRNSACSFDSLCFRLCFSNRCENSRNPLLSIIKYLQIKPKSVHSCHQNTTIFYYKSLKRFYFQWLCSWSKTKYKSDFNDKSDVNITTKYFFKRPLPKISASIPRKIKHFIKVNKSVYIASRTYQFCWS